MLASIKADIRKLITIRSTYFIGAIAIFIMGAVSFYVEGYRGNSGSPAALATDRAFEVIIGQTTLVVIALAIISILHMAHEYRYNTILYTLTANISRTKVLLSKAVALSLFSLIFGALIIAVSLICYMLGLSLRDVTLPGQSIDWIATLAKMAFYFVAYSLIGLFVAVIIRNLVGAIVFFFVVPNTVESMLRAFWLKDNAIYLPFQSLDNVVRVQLANGPMSGPSSIESLFVAVGYIAILGIGAWLLFLKRDAN